MNVTNGKLIPVLVALIVLLSGIVVAMISYAWRGEDMIVLNDRLIVLDRKFDAIEWRLEKFVNRETYELAVRLGIDTRAEMRGKLSEHLNSSHDIREFNVSVFPDFVGEEAP